MGWCLERVQVSRAEALITRRRSQVQAGGVFGHGMHPSRVGRWEDLTRWRATWCPTRSRAASVIGVCSAASISDLASRLGTHGL